MTDLRTAAQQALEALYETERLAGSMAYPAAEVASAITALRAALAEPVQEPEPGEYHGWVLREVLFDNGEPVGHREPVQGPVAWYFEARHIDSAWAAAVTLKHPGAEGVYMRNVKPLYTAPPQRKPLTDEEIKEVAEESGIDTKHIPRTVLFIARVIEAAHGIKE